MPHLSERVALNEEVKDHRALLEDLQCNILSSHGRANTHYFFLRFPNDRVARDVLKTLAGINPPQQWPVPGLTSELSTRNRRGGKPVAAGSLSSSLLLSAKCYREFLREFKMPADPAFQAGLADRRDLLNDPDFSVRGFSPVHALYMVGYDPKDNAWPDASRNIQEYLEGSGVGFRDVGGYVLRHNGLPIEPFGYRDSISQPLFFESDMQRRRGVAVEGKAATASEGRWSSLAPLSAALVEDPNGATARASGSYVVYRKLQQKVGLFYEQAERLSRELLADKIELSRDKVADRLVGRQINGKPLDEAPSLNDFVYPAESLCPMHAHARKMNPRDNYARGRRLVRRSTVYGPRLEPRKGSSRPELDGKYNPVLAKGEQHDDDGVGLMFLCCQASIVEQFEAIQVHWANQRLGGADPVIGQLPEGPANMLGFSGSGIKYRYDPVVTLLEGEYFFAPSIGFFSRI